MQQSRTPRRPALLAALLALMLAVVGCGRGEDETAVNLEPVSHPGANPFTPPTGSDQPSVTPPPGSAGTFPGDTVGLFGGTRNAASCDKAQLVAFLKQDPAKAAAWASVVGIAVGDIEAFVATLTPAVLRSDTRVTNHGFVDGKATDIPAVLQAGTAVLVDPHGMPVTKCFCGNPLTPPTAIESKNFIGSRWSSFSQEQVTVIAPVTQNVQQFVLVDPGTGQSFQRPSGTTGRQDVPATAPAPSAFPTPTAPVPPPTAGITPGPPRTVPPPGVVPPSPTASPTPSAPGIPTVTSAPPATATAAPTTPGATSAGATTPGATTPGATTPGATTAAPTAAPTTAPTPPATTPVPTTPGATGPVVPPPGATGTATPVPTQTVTPTPATPTATPSQTGILRASWSVGDCFVRDGEAHGLVLLRPDSMGTRTFTVTVRLGLPTAPIAEETVRVTAAPGQIGQAEVKAPTSTPNGSVQCAVLSVVDENRQPVVAGEPLPPPLDSSPMPGQPGPGVPGGPTVPQTAPPPILPGGTPPR